MEEKENKELKNKIIEVLIQKGRTLFDQGYKNNEFTKDKMADKLLNDIKNYPHAFVLACIMDRQIKAERAWLIPYKISKEIGGFQFLKLLDLNLDQIEKIFNEKKLHRFNDTMAKNFYSGIQTIHKNYENDNDSRKYKIFYHVLW